MVSSANALREPVTSYEHTTMHLKMACMYDDLLRHFNQLCFEDSVTWKIEILATTFITTVLEERERNEHVPLSEAQDKYQTALYHFIVFMKNDFSRELHPEAWTSARSILDRGLQTIYNQTGIDLFLPPQLI